MIRNKLFAVTAVGAIAASALGFAGAVQAKDSERPTDEAAVMANAKVSMAQAITTAEQQVGGKAVDSGIEDQNGTVFLEVTVLTGTQKHRVLIDPQSGQVVKTALDNNDERDNGHERDDD